jgi:hypothetical protein
MLNMTVSFKNNVNIGNSTGINDVLEKGMI